MNKAALTAELLVAATMGKDSVATDDDEEEIIPLITLAGGIKMILGPPVQPAAEIT